MKLMRILCLLLVTAVLASCGPRVSTMKTTEKDLSRYDSFAYLPNTGIDMPDQAMNDETVNQAVIEAINNNLRQAGYNLDRQNPDLLVLVSTKTNTEIGTTTDPVYAGYPYDMGVTTIGPYYNSYYFNGYAGFNNIVGYDTDTYAYKEGTVVINLVDRETKNTVWKGVASESIFEQPTVQAIRELVNAIFEEYPLIEE